MLLKYLEKIDDPRRAQGKRFALSDFLLFSILAILSGAKSYRDINRFISKKLTKLNKMFGLSWNKAPSKSQTRDIICALDKNEVEKAFRGYSGRLLKDKTTTSALGIDGKSLRGSFDYLKSQDMLQMLSGFCSESKLILGHVDIAEKTNEIPTAQQLIKELGLPEGTIYTMDAMHCQKKPSKQLRKQKVS